MPRNKWLQNRTGEMLRALAALPEDPDLVPVSTWWCTTIHPSSSRGPNAFLYLCRHQAHMKSTYTYASKTLTA